LKETNFRPLEIVQIDKRPLFNCLPEVSLDKFTDFSGFNIQSEEFQAMSLI